MIFVNATFLLTICRVFGGILIKNEAVFVLLF